MSVTNESFQFKLLGALQEMPVSTKTKHHTKPKSATTGLEPLLSKIPTEPYYEDKTKTFVLFKENSLDLLPRIPDESIDMIFADPPYFLSNGGMSCHAGKRVSVNKGKWDESNGIEDDYIFTSRWLQLCQQKLTPNGTIWVSGTSHIIHIVGFSMQKLGFKILNDIAWFKVNPPPNLSCRYFTHSTETILWAAKNKKSKHQFDYKLMKKLNNNKQMLSLWHIKAPVREEKIYGKHPTQKPIKLLERIIQASTRKGDTVLDPFNGSGTTGLQAYLQGRRYIGIDLEKDYLELTKKRFKDIS